MGSCKTRQREKRKAVNVKQLVDYRRMEEHVQLKMVYLSQIEIDKSEELRDELLSVTQSPALWAFVLNTMTEAWQNK